VNPAITNSAVAGMPLSQAGVAAAIASTSRHVGAAIGVAVSGSVVAVSQARGTDFTMATHAIWWVMTASGAAVLVLGFASNTAWARGSTERVAHLFEESHWFDIGQFMHNRRVSSRPSAGVYWLLAVMAALMFLGSFLPEKNAPGKGGSVAAHQHRKGQETCGAVRNSCR